LVSAGRSPNRLQHEKSPYLLQHALNPVDWRPWGDEAFAVARAEDKPVFLSVGYSTCHWCHVMERESFEDDALAAVLNEGFVPVKVDREERPDVDRVYMRAAAEITGSGGWPLTVFLTPEGEPFYAGTYFPPETRYGRPGLRQVLTTVREAWRTRRDEVLRSARELAGMIEGAVLLDADPDAVGAEETATHAYEHLSRMFDAGFGGFGSAPKFPQPSFLFFLLRRWVEGGEPAPLEMTAATLRRMSWGGIHDHLGGGFHRYSTDAEWRVPHFEKMLYDQAQLVGAYLEGYQASGDPAFAAAVRDILDYVARDLRDPAGGFHSAEDADSLSSSGESVEGAFYVWTAAEIDAALGPDLAPPFRAHYGITDAGNFENGWNVLHASGSPRETAERLGVDPVAFEGSLQTARARLGEIRARRARPHRDDKVLVGWNGLMISAFARAAQVLDDGTPAGAAQAASDLATARAATEFIHRHLYDEKSSTLYRRWRAGEAAIPGELSDYAFLVQALLDLYEAAFDVSHLEHALLLTDEMVVRFWDEKNGGFFDTAAGADPRLPRTKEAHDGAEPSGNSIAVANLFRLAHALDRRDLEEKARRTVALFGAHAARSPLASTMMWSSAHWTKTPPVQVVVAGAPEAADTRELLRSARAPLRPAKVVILADGGAGQEWLARHAGTLREMRPVEGRAAAYVCENFICRTPTTDPQELARLLRAKAVAIS
jgi:hypothetical protein